MDVFLLWHQHDLGDGDTSDKLIGVYSSHTAAEDAKRRAASLEGFRDLPDGFVIDRYAVDRDHWTTGYVTERW